MVVIPFLPPHSSLLRFTTLNFLKTIRFRSSVFLHRPVSSTTRWIAFHPIHAKTACISVAGRPSSRLLELRHAKMYPVDSFDTTDRVTLSMGLEASTTCGWRSHPGLSSSITRCIILSLVSETSPRPSNQEILTFSVSRRTPLQVASRLRAIFLQ
jgi:hypothetical protein